MITSQSAVKITHPMPLTAAHPSAAPRMIVTAPLDTELKRFFRSQRTAGIGGGAPVASGVTRTLMCP